ncbi:MAG: CDP-alcohol phosphatidyltransferase family protein [Planctomycetota bacterium]
MPPGRLRTALPWALVCVRPPLGALGVLVAWLEWPRWIWLVSFVLAILSDVYDGKLARRFGVATEGLRRADSIADDLFAYASLATFWIAEPGIVSEHGWGLIALIALDLLRVPLDWWRFGKRSSYHATSMRAFGLSLIPVGVLLMMRGDVHGFLWLALALGAWAEVEGALMTLILPRWTVDVRHIGVALALRRDARAGAGAGD